MAEFECRLKKYRQLKNMTQEQLAEYDCPIQLISHGPVPHTVLTRHPGCACSTEASKPTTSEPQ